jgi:hypothetical protein
MQPSVVVPGDPGKDRLTRLDSGREAATSHSSTFSVVKKASATAHPDIAGAPRGAADLRLVTAGANAAEVYCEPLMLSRLSSC